MTHAPKPGRRARAAEMAAPAQPEIFRLLDQADSRAAALGQSVGRTERLAELGLWAAMIAHEFNNILTPVLSYSQIALSRPDDRELAAQALERAAAGVERAVAVAELIMDFLRSPNAEPGPLEARVEACFDGVAARLGRTSGKDGVTIRKRIGTDVAVAINEAGLGQVLHNLLANAWRELAERGGGVIEIETRGCSTWNRGVEILFRDTGPGLPAPARLRLGMPWEDAMSQNGAARGNGLGLLVCRRLVESAGGKIEVIDEEGWGTVFRILLPAA